MRDYGAVGNSQQLNTAAIQGAPPAGRYLSATLQIGSPRTADYSHDELVFHGDRTSDRLIHNHSAHHIMMIGIEERH